ncbi:MAG: hypothetical protein R6U50_06515 [Desulfobacterales bacterium]
MIADSGTGMAFMLPPFINFDGLPHFLGGKTPAGKYTDTREEHK